MRALVTGAGGWIGSRLVAELARQGQEVHALVRPGRPAGALEGLLGAAQIHRADLLDLAGLRQIVGDIRPQVIYHLAAHGVGAGEKDRPAIVAACVLGTAHLLEALAGHDYHALLAAGTAWECDGAVIHESAPFAPCTDYGTAKAAAALLVLNEARQGRPTRLVRIFSAYGPGERNQRLVPYLMDCCLRGADPEVSHGTQVRDFIHVDDAVALFLAAARSDLAPGTVLHAATGTGHTVRDLIETVLAQGGSSVRPRYGARPVRAHEPAISVASIARTTDLTGWRPQFDLTAGIRATWDWRRRQGSQAA